MRPEQDQALSQGGRVLQFKLQLDKLFDQFQDQQVEKDQQVQQSLCQGNTYLKSAQTIREAEALLEQLQACLTSEGRGISGLPLAQVREVAADLCQKLRQEEDAARQELQKSLQQAASSLLQGLEVSRDIKKLGDLCCLAGACEERLNEMTEMYPEPSGKGGGSGVGSNPERQNN